MVWPRRFFESMRRWTACTVVDAGVRAASADQRIFDDLVEVGLAAGPLTGRALRATARRLLTPPGRYAPIS